MSHALKCFPATMTRKKVHLAYIAGDSARKATYKKRKKGLLKKMSELTTLCGVEACAIVCSPQEPEPVVWPDRERAQKVVEDFQDLPEMDRHRRMFDHPAYLWQRINKSSQQLVQILRENRQKTVALAMYGCLTGEKNLDDLTGLDLNDLGWMVECNLADIGRQLEALGQVSTDPATPTPQQPMPNAGLTMPAPPDQLPAMGGSTFGLGLGWLTRMPMQGPSRWQFHPAAEAGSSSGAGESSSIQPVFSGEPN